MFAGVDGMLVFLNPLPAITQHDKHTQDAVMSATEGGAPLIVLELNMHGKRGRGGMWV